MQTQWLSPTDWVTGDPSLVISYPFVSHPDTIITSKSVGDFKWISMGLRLPEGVSIEDVIICYQVSNARSFISQVRLAEMRTPNQAIVIYDDGTDLQSNLTTCYSSHVGGKVPAPGSAVTLELRLSFQHTGDEIRLGAVGIKIQPPVIVPSYIRASLPPAGNLGSLARVVDDVRGLWMDTGSIDYQDGAGDRKQWFRVSGQAVNVREFGAMGDGATDDTIAISAALAAAAPDGCSVYLPSGTYMCRGNVVIPFTGCHMFGDTTQDVRERGGTIIVFGGVNNGFVVPAHTYSWTMRDVLIHVGAHAGPAILFNDPTGDHCLENVHVQMGNPAASAIQGGTLTQNGGIEMNPAFFRRMRIFAGAAYSKPLIALYGKGGGLNNITFEECWIEGVWDGTAPLVVFEATDSGLIADINFEKCLFEIPIAGAIRFRSASRVRVSACWAGDLTGHAPTNPIFEISSASVDGISGALPSQNYLFDTLQTDAGSHGAATIYCPGQNGGVVLLNCSIPWLDNGFGGGDLNPFGNPFLNIGSRIYNGWDGDPPLGTTEGGVAGFRVRTFAVQTGAQILASGPNEDVRVGSSGSASKVRIAAGNGTTTGPNAAFSIGGLQNGGDGQLLYLYNESSFQMTLKNESTGSQDINRITTLTGTEVVLRAAKSYAVLQYDGYDKRWILVSTN